MPPTAPWAVTLGPLVLLTTNDDLGRLHPAVTGPGRCLSRLKFRRRDAGESAAWLGRPVASGHTLAELYELKHGGTVDTDDVSVGPTYEQSDSRTPGQPRAGAALVGRPRWRSDDALGGIARVDS